jgi:prepilin-type processing-associated H-X9-DG protein/prepilin-type N-terminal cleavage/methylation domain-containing protein
MLAVERKGEMRYCWGVTRRRQNTNSAFTLIELLVVIGIIGILAALLLTAVSQTKGRSLRIQCANNVRQLGMGLQEFVADNGTYPFFFTQPGGSYRAGLIEWPVSIRNELLAKTGSSDSIWIHQGVWQCPSAIRPQEFKTEGEFHNYLSYGYNGFGLATLTDTNSLGLGGHRFSNDGTLHIPLSPPVSESEVASPSDMMAIGDGFCGGNGVLQEGWELSRAYGIIDYLGSTKSSYARHQGRANVAFCDGHVESPTLQFLFEDTSDAALVRWNRDHLPHREKLSP